MPFYNCVPIFFLNQTDNALGSTTQNNYLWDESNRLRVIVQDEKYTQNYFYDAGGERVLKASADYTAVFENGQLQAPANLTINAYTEYPSAFMVITPDGQYSKHYYSGTQRIVSRIGDKKNSIFDLPDTSNPESRKLQQVQKQDVQKYLDKAKIKVTFKENERPIDPCIYMTIEECCKRFPERCPQEPKTEKIYYFHPDHLGTTTFLTDANGDCYQFFLNLPFGETMAEQKSITQNYATPYKFTGKELDEETGLYYFGARYYAPRESIWLSTDPLAEKYPSFSPYAYCLNNPIKFVDPDGRAPMDHWQLNNQGKLELIKKTNDNFNVFFDEKGNKLFQTNQVSNEGLKWSTKLDEYFNKVNTVFLEIANEPKVYNQMLERAEQTGFDNKIASIPQMKESGEAFKSSANLRASLDVVLQSPKWAVGYAYAGAVSTFGMVSQGVKSIYTSATATNLAKDAKYLFHQALENSKTFMSDFKKQLNDGMSTLSKGQWGNSQGQTTN